MTKNSIGIVLFSGFFFAFSSAGIAADESAPPAKVPSHNSSMPPANPERTTSPAPGDRDNKYEQTKTFLKDYDLTMSQIRRIFKANPETQIESHFACYKLTTFRNKWYKCNTHGNGMNAYAT